MKTLVAAPKQVSSPLVLRTVSDLRNFTAARRAPLEDGKRRTIALIPTMGALHDGHLALVRKGLEMADTAIATIFVNPKQFGPNEDFASYPRTWEADLEKLAAAGAHAVFHPSPLEMYPAEFATSISVRGVSEGLCGAARPGHFDGVATVVVKLLMMTQPDIALFGEKDWQQLAVIRRAVTDLNIPVVIHGVPTVRDAHGLALSSRNAYLTPEQLATARQLNKILFAMADKIGGGGDIAALKKESRAALKAAGFETIDYLEVCEARSLAPAAAKNGKELRILAAARLGRARLIDNVAA